MVILGSEAPTLVFRGPLRHFFLVLRLRSQGFSEHELKACVSTGLCGLDDMRLCEHEVLLHNARCQRAVSKLGSAEQ